MKYSQYKSFIFSFLYEIRLKITIKIKLLRLKFKLCLSIDYYNRLIISISKFIKWLILNPNNCYFVEFRNIILERK